MITYIALFVLGAALGVLFARAEKFLDDIKGDFLCYHWPFCWKRATHYIATDDDVLTDEGMCHRHCELRAVEIVTETDADPAICTLPEAFNRARVNRALQGDD